MKISIGVNHGEPDYSHSVMLAKINQWKALHVSGILLDCAGVSYGVSEQRRVWVTATGSQFPTSAKSIEQWVRATITKSIRP